MIKAIGKYFISKDNGDNWLECKNSLVSGYFNSSTEGSSYLAVGDNGNTVDYDDTAIPSLAISDLKSGFSGGVITAVQADTFSITRSQDYEFGSGNNFIMYDIGLVCNGSLASRSLFKDNQGVPVSIPVSEDDLLKARYQLEYTLPRSAIRAEINYNGIVVGANVYFVNPNKWTNSVIGEPMVCSSVGVGNSWTIGTDAYLTGELPISSTSNVTIVKSNSNDKKVYTCSFFTTLTELVGTFEQIIFCNGTAAPGNAIVMIDLDEAINKTSDDVFSLSVSIVQEPFNVDP